jgi:hypothetical protein
MSTDDDAKHDAKEDAKAAASEADAAAEDASSTEAEASTAAETAAEEEAAPRSKPSGKSKKARQEERRAAEARAKSAIRPSQAIVYALMALAAGGAAGWFGHIAQAKAKLRADITPAASGSAASAGPCGAWEKKICAGSGEQSATCQQAKGATGLLTPSTCELALETVPATLAKVKAERASCDSLVSKLCKDLPPGSAACNLVTERTQMFPAERCKEFLQNYDSVLAEVKMLDQQAAMQGGAQPPGMPHGMPPGMPPGAQPQP